MHYFILNHVPLIWSINCKSAFYYIYPCMVHKCRGSLVYQSHLFMLICWYWVQITNTYVETTPSSGVQCPHSWALSPLCCYSLPLHIQSYKLCTNCTLTRWQWVAVVTCPHPATYPATSPSHLTPCTGPLLICRSMNNAQTFYKNL